MLASGFRAAPAPEPPPDLARRVAEQETANAEARENYTYRQEVRIRDFDRRGRPGGHYHEVREVVFSPESGRSESFLKGPIDRLVFLKLTEEDFRDIREVQPFLFTADQLSAYETRYRGTELIDGEEYYVLDVAPRQVFYGYRYFDGTLWIDREDLAVVQSFGKAVPPVFKGDSDNLFPHFTTIREKIDGRHWFPVHTHADDLLPFRGGPVRIKMTIKYSEYRRFGSESSIEFQVPEQR